MIDGLRGIIPPIVTPFKPTFEINDEALRSLIHFLIHEGVHGLVVCGSCGEFAYLSLEERVQVTDIAIKEVKGKVPVIVGTGALRTDDAVMLTEYAKKKKATAVLVAPPFYDKLTDEEIYEYYKAIAEIGLDVIIYNIPITTKINLTPEFLIRLTEDFKNIKYVKETTGDIQRIQEILMLSKGKITILNGWDTIAYEAFTIGAKGWIAGVANFIPKICIELYNLVTKGELQKAKDLYYKLLPLLTYIGKSGKYIQCIKTALEFNQFNVGPTRKPHIPLTIKEKEILKNMLKEIGII